MILDFQLSEHQRFLSKFTELFKVIDSNEDGIISEDEFMELIRMMNVITHDEEIEYLLQVGDPFNNQMMTYSDVISLLSG